jgi:uncharacterized protein with HEPN domain
VAAVPSVPWKQIAAMRDPVAHLYFDTTHGLVATAVGRELSELEHAVARLLAART